MALDRSEERLLVWLRSMLYVESDRQPTSFAVSHVTGKGGIGSDIASHDRADLGESIDENELERFARTLLTVMESDAEGLGGLQRYVVRAFKGKSRKPLSRIALRLNIREHDDSVDTEPPTMDGVVSQMMRHNEALQRNLNAGLTSSMNHQARMISTLSGMVESMMAEKFENMHMIEELLSRKQDRDLEAYKVEQKERRFDESLQIVKKFAPHLVQRMLPGAAPPGEEGIPRKNIGEFLSTLSAGQLESIKETLTNEQLAFLTSAIAEGH